MRKLYLEVLLLLILFAGGWAAFSIFFSHSAPAPSRLLSVESEQSMAEQLHGLVLQQHRPMDSQKWQLRVDTIMHRLSKAAGKPAGYFKVQLLEENTQNAFATLDGRIYLFQGMLDLAGSPEVLAAVLAHEMGHLLQHDFENRLRNEIGLTAIMAIFSGGNAQTITELGKTVFSLDYDRQQEQQADAYASELLAKAAIHPDRLTELFLKLKRTEQAEVPETLNFLLTHPHLKYRIEQASQHPADPTFAEQPFALEWD